MKQSIKKVNSKKTFSNDDKKQKQVLNLNKSKSKAEHQESKLQNDKLEN